MTERWGKNLCGMTTLKGTPCKWPKPCEFHLPALDRFPSAEDIAKAEAFRAKKATRRELRGEVPVFTEASRVRLPDSRGTAQKKRSQRRRSKPKTVKRLSGVLFP